MGHLPFFLTPPPRVLTCTIDFFLRTTAGLEGLLLAWPPAAAAGGGTPAAGLPVCHVYGLALLANYAIQIQRSPQDVIFMESAGLSLPRLAPAAGAAAGGAGAAASGAEAAGVAACCCCCSILLRKLPSFLNGSGGLSPCSNKSGISPRQMNKAGYLPDEQGSQSTGKVRREPPPLTPQPDPPSLGQVSHFLKGSLRRTAG